MSKTKRRRLTDEKASFLGLDLNKHDEGRNTARYALTKEQILKLDKEFPRVKNETNPNNYKNDTFFLSAWDYKNNKLLNIEEFCERYGLDYNNVTSFKFLPHHYKEPSYHIVFKEDFVRDDFDYLGELEKQLKVYKPHKRIREGENVGVITLTDLHFGAYISAMNVTPEFSISVLCEMLNYAAEKVNRLFYDKVHLHLLGDLIESFTGLNHKNSWKGLDKGMFGVSAIKLFVELFKKHFLDKVYNLGKIKIVAGNHDRVTSSNDEDTDGGSAELIAWGLKLIGYDVEFSRDVLTHKVDSVNYILNHGHLHLTKKMSTKEICWTYGEKGVFNFITEGHLHSRINKLSANQIKNFTMVTDDTIDCRRQVCPSLFTGNSYSEDGGWSTLAGFLVSESNDKGTGVNVFDFSI